MGRDMPIDCDRCGGVLDWGDFGPVEDGSVGTTCTCPPPPPLPDLALALKLLDEILGTSTPCNIEGWTCSSHEMWNIPYQGPCPVGQAQELLTRLGMRDG